MEAFKVYSRDCLSCGHLVDGLPVDDRKPCLFKNGNKRCPASEVRIIISGRIERLAKKYQNARLLQDAKTEARILSYISKESETGQRLFYKLINHTSS